MTMRGGVSCPSSPCRTLAHQACGRRSRNSERTPARRAATRPRRSVTATYSARARSPAFGVHGRAAQARAEVGFAEARSRCGNPSPARHAQALFRQRRRGMVRSASGARAGPPGTRAQYRHGWVGLPSHQRAQARVRESRVQRAAGGPAGQQTRRARQAWHGDGSCCQPGCGRPGQRRRKEVLSLVEAWSIPKRTPAVYTASRPAGALGRNSGPERPFPLYGRAV